MVADALRHDLFWKYFRRKDGKVGNVFPAGMGTPVATLALLYGITPSFLYWPSKVEEKGELLKTFDALIIFRNVKKIKHLAITKILEENKVMTFALVFNDLAVPAPFVEAYRPCTNNLVVTVKRWLNRFVPNLLEGLGFMDIFISQNPLISFISEEKGDCAYIMHTRGVKRFVFRKLKEFERHDNVFVYMHLLTPHEPYLCREFYEIVKIVKDVIRNAKYSVFRKKYVELIRGSYKSNREESISRLRKFYERFEELEKILEVNKVLIDVKESYKACVKEVIEFLVDLIEKFGKDWKIVFTSDHPEYFGEGGIIQHEYPFPFGKTLRSPLYIHGEYGELGEIYQTQIPELISHFFGINYKSKAREKVMEDLRYLGAPLLSFYTEEGGAYVRIHSDEGLEFEMGSESGKGVVMRRIRRAMLYRGLLKR